MNFILRKYSKENEISHYNNVKCKYIKASFYVKMHKENPAKNIDIIYETHNIAHNCL